MSVIIVTHGGRDRALTTVRSAQAALGRATAEWIVVDSGSPDDTPDVLEREFPDVTVIRRQNVGFAAANNVGIEQARGRYVLLLNPDTEILRGTFDSLVAVMDLRPEVGLASILHKWPDGRLQFSMRRFPTAARFLGDALLAWRLPPLRSFQEMEIRADRYASEHPADWLVGAFLFARREAILSVGPLDGQFFLYSEEIDWAYRMHRGGWEVRHIPVMEMLHHGGLQSGGDLMSQLTYSRLLYAAKHFGRAGRAATRFALALDHSLRCAIMAATSLAKPGLRPRAAAEFDALAVSLGLRGPPLKAPASS